MQTIDNLEIPELKYYIDGYGDRHESSFLCRELDDYGHNNKWMYKYKDKFEHEWEFWNWINSEDDSAEYFYYCRQLGILNEENYIYAPSRVLKAIEDSKNFIPIPKITFSVYGKYNIKCAELFKSCKNPYKIIEWLDEELVRLQEEKKLAYEVYLNNIHLPNSKLPNRTIEQDKRAERCNNIYSDIKEIEEIKKYLTLYER